MVLNATEWVENYIGVDIQKEIVITYKFAAFKGADQLFRISSVGRMCQIEYETAGRNVVNTQTVYAGEDVDIMVTEIDRLLCRRYGKIVYFHSKSKESERNLRLLFIFKKN